MGKTRGVDLRRQRDYGRYRDRGRIKRVPLGDTNEVDHQRRVNRAQANWRVKPTDEGTGAVTAFEPGGVFMQVFDGGDDPFGDALAFAARCLRGEADPAALP